MLLFVRLLLLLISSTIAIETLTFDDDFSKFQQSLTNTLNYPGLSFPDESEQNYDNSVLRDQYDDVYGYPEVMTGKGKIKGQTNPYAHSFFGIHYAEAPIGEKRFMPPIEKTYQEEIDASQVVRTQCIQNEQPRSEEMEDCLVLNIHVPSTYNFTDSDQPLLPVLLWIHGGSFATGSGTSKSCDGRFLSNSTQTVIVSINYRLGALGSFVYEENGIEFKGNQGIKDQQLALKWVSDEIQNFGGDPKKITIFGVSAGAQSVMFHLASKNSKAYFTRAIQESNPAVYNYHSLEVARQISNNFIPLLNCSDGSSNIECLRNVDPGLIIAKTQAIRGMALKERDHRSTVEPFRPVVGDDEFPYQPFEMFQRGNWNKDVEVIMGTNREELSDINRIFYGRNLTYKFFKTVNKFLVGEELAPNVTEKYSSLVEGNVLEAEYTDIIAQLVADLYFVCPSRLMARFITKTSTSPNTYYYSWEHRSCDDPQQACYYSCHACEYSYVFNTRSYTGQTNGVSEQAISAMFSDFWGTFAYDGVPLSDANDEWIKYEKVDSMTWKNMHMMHPPRSQIEDNYRQDLCDFWDSLNFYVKIDDSLDPNDGEGNGGGATSVQTSLLSLVAAIFVISFIL